jgi:hypothetical protein
MRNNMSKKIQTFHDYMQSRIESSAPKKINKRGKMAKGDYNTGLFGGGQGSSSSSGAPGASEAAAQRAAQQAAQRAAEQAQRRADAEANQRDAQARASQQNTQAQNSGNGAAQAAQASATNPVASTANVNSGNGAAAAAQNGNTRDAGDIERDRRRADEYARAQAAAKARAAANQNGAAQAAQAGATNPVYYANTGNGAAQAAQAGATTDPILRRQAEVQRALNQRANTSVGARGNVQGGSGVGQFIDNAVSNVLRNFSTPAYAQEVESSITPTTPAPETVTPEPEPPKTITPITPNPVITPETPTSIVPGEGGKKTPVPSKLNDWAAYLDWVKKTSPIDIWNNTFGTSDIIVTRDEKGNPKNTDFVTIDGNGNPIYRNTNQQWIKPGARGFLDSYIGENGLDYYIDPNTNEKLYYQKDVPDARVPTPGALPDIENTPVPEIPPNGYDFDKSKAIALSVLGLGNLQSKRVDGKLVPYNPNILGLDDSTYTALIRASKGSSALTDEQVTEIKNKTNLIAQQNFVDSKIRGATSDFNISRQKLVDNIATLTKNPNDYTYLYQNPVFSPFQNNSPNLPTAPKYVADMVAQAGNVASQSILGTAIANTNNLVGTQSAGGPKIITPPPSPQPTLTPRPTTDPKLVISSTPATITSDNRTRTIGNGKTVSTPTIPTSIRSGTTPRDDTLQEIPHWTDSVPYLNNAYRNGASGSGSKESPLILPIGMSMPQNLIDEWRKAGRYIQNPNISVVSNTGPTRTPLDPNKPTGPNAINLQNTAIANENNRALTQTAGARNGNYVQTATPTPTPTKNIGASGQPTGTGPNQSIPPTRSVPIPTQASLDVAQDEIAQILNEQRLNQQQAASAYPQFAPKQARMSPSKKTGKLKKDIGVGTGLTAHATQPVPESPMPKIRTSYGSYKFKKPQQQQRSAKYGEDQQLTQPIRKQINAVQPRQTMQNVMQFPPSDGFQSFAKMMINPMEKYEKNNLTKSLQQNSKYNNAYSNKKYEK